MSRKTTSVAYRIVKQNSTADSETSDVPDSSSEGGGKYKYTSITESNYKKPKDGSRQDNFTKEQIRDKLDGYKALKTSQEKRYLLTLKPFKVWVRYFNTVTKEFRVGGLLKVVDPDLRYIMLVNTSKNLTWSVQLKDCIIFVPNNLEQKQLDKEKEQITKNKLYTLYRQGKLSKN